MIDYNPGGTGDLDAITSSGAPVARDPASGLLTLVAGTYFVPVGSDQAPTPSMASLCSTQLAWSSAFVATITVETCNFPGGSERKGAGKDNVTDWDTTAGNWLPQNPSTAYVPCVGGSVSNMTVTTNAQGGCEFDIGNLGARRERIKLIVTTGGTVRINRRGKNAA